MRMAAEWSCWKPKLSIGMSTPGAIGTRGIADSGRNSNIIDYLGSIILR